MVENESFAALWAIQKLRGHLEGVRFSLITDHYSLKWPFTINDPVDRILRGTVRLQQYDFEIVHRNSRENVVDDTLRSVPTISASQSQDPGEVPEGK